MGTTLSERRMDLDRLTQMEIDNIEQEKDPPIIRGIDC